MSKNGETTATGTSGIANDGWICSARCIVSPNFDDRPVGIAISLLVVHAISLPPSSFGNEHIERLFTNTLDPNAHPYFLGISTLRVSAHFLIRRDGELIQFVSCLQRAWHAGVSSWHGRDRCNDFSIGIELEGCDDLPFEERQYLRIVSLIESLRTCYPIDAVVGHADISPGRKTDPGPYFDWQRVAVHESLLVRAH